MSFAQQRLWYLDQLDPDSAVYNLPVAFKLSGKLDEEALEKSLNEIIKRHEALRTTFGMAEGMPVQMITPTLEIEFPLLDISHRLPAERDLELAELLSNEAGRTFDLTKGPLIRAMLVRLEETSHVLFLMTHHIISDDWSFGVIQRELAALYEAFIGNNPSPLPRLPIQYVDYAVRQREWLEGGELARQLEHWREQLRGDNPPLQMPADKPRPPVRTSAGALEELMIPPETIESLSSLGREEGATLFMVLLAAFKTLLYRYTDQETVSVGSPIANRALAETEDVIGFFVNTLVLRTSYQGEPSFRELLRRVREVCLAAYSHRDIPFERLVEELHPERDTSRTPLFQALFAFQEGDGVPTDLAGISMTPMDIRTNVARTDLSFWLEQTDQGLRATMEYSTDLFEPPTITRLLRHYQTLLETVLANPDASIATMPFMPPDERELLLVSWNATEAAYPEGESVHQLVEAQAEKTPDAVAVVHKETQLTYRELTQRANQIARYLQKHKVRPGMLIGICMERSSMMLATLLGILKTGSAYVPLDPQYPKERIEFILEDAQVEVLLSEESIVSKLPATDAQVLCMDVEEKAISQESVQLPTIEGETAELAYVIYTSGSTGKPKGVQVPHCAVAAFLTSMAREPGLTKEDVLLAVTTLSFDISVLELFGPLTVGARTVIADQGSLSGGPQLLETMADSGVTVMQATPATWRVVVEAGWKGAEHFKILCGGEALPRDLAGQLVERSGNVWNMYGPTETTVWSSCYRLTKKDSPVLIGRPIANTTMYILDHRQQPVPVGVPGELYIGGAGVTRGYLNRPELNEERFLPDPFSTDPKARLYRTGDLVKYHSDGNIEYLNRLDNQVKVRGFRIELGEIEAVFSTHEAVEQCVVVVREDRPGDRRLVAYFVPKPDFDPTVTELRKHLRTKLPEYMIPQHFVDMDSLPLTPNGKVDRKALPGVLGTDRPEMDVEFVAPQSDVEKRLVAIFESILSVSGIGIRDNFFELGGNSLQVLKTLTLLRQELQADVPVVRFFQQPTIESIALFVEQGSEASSQTAETRSFPSRSAADSTVEDVAIIGMGGRFPGARNVNEFWQNVCGGVESITFFDPDGLDPSLPETQTKDPAYVRARGILEDVELFDAAFFGIPPKEAEVMDPQHRIFLEVSWEVLEEAGYVPGRYPGAIGVWGGMHSHTYFEKHVMTRPDLVDRVGEFQVRVSNEKDYAATRVAHKLNLKGPAVSVNTACSTSLVAVVEAFHGLRAHLCDMAIAGGVSVTCPPRSGYVYQEGAMLSPDGHTRAFDADGQGTVFNDGAAVLLLKRLKDALADGDSIYGVIKGASINNDGAFKASFTAPSVDGQAAVIRAAHTMADIDPRTITYVETHGTATPVGDPIEFEALTQAFRVKTRDKGFCAIGSVKSNVGHLVTAAGGAGLIKTALALTHRKIPPSLHYSSPNPNIPFAESPFYVNAKLSDWPNGVTPRRAGVSSFGVGGTNAHVVVEEPPTAKPSGPSRPRQLLVLSARTSTALESSTEQLREHLEQNPNIDLADVAYTLMVGRKTFSHRRALVAKDVTEALALLRGKDTTRVLTRKLRTKEPNIAFLFPGQGAQYVNMGANLYRDDPTYRAVVDYCSEVLDNVLERDLRQLIFPEKGDGEAEARALRRTEITQPALFVTEYALAQLWISWGIQPRAMIGHSVGEFVAATLAGVMSLEDALRLVANRGRLMGSQPEGAMLSVRQPAEEIAPRLTGSLAMASDNGPQLCVVAGPCEEITKLEQELTAEDVACRALHTSHAFHSPMMDAVLEPFAELVGAVALNEPKIPFVSTATGTWIANEQATDPLYWARHLRETVRFREGIATLLADPSLALLEVGPRATLSTLSRQQLKDRSKLVVSSLGDGAEGDAEWTALLSAVGQLWAAGVQLDTNAFYVHEDRRRVPLPTYPFERKRFWVEPAAKWTEPPPTVRLEEQMPKDLLSEEAPATEAPTPQTGVPTPGVPTPAAQWGPPGMAPAAAQMGSNQQMMWMMQQWYQQQVAMWMSMQGVGQMPQGMASPVASPTAPAPSPAATDASGVATPTRTEAQEKDDTPPFEAKSIVK